MKGRHWITLGSLALTLVAVQQPVLAQNGDAGGGEVREDRRDIREDRSELRSDRRDLRQDVQSGASPGQIAQDRRDIRQDRQDLRKDHRDLRHDRQTGVETGENYGSTWLAAKATAVKYLWAREAGNNLSCCRLCFTESAFVPPARSITSALRQAQ